ncbi:hypothetical protein MNV49_001122 [Pseudohyphozyma bogoriensis]|nr:hypothetical protein MNV49_001122 [Pseudohyphozyma bogoriensis]
MSSRHDRDHRERDSRSASPGPRPSSHSHSSRSHHRDRRDRSRSRSPKRPSKEYPGLPRGVDEIEEADYFLKATELKVWLDEVKGKRLGELSGENARAYFKKFVKGWNRGLLDAKFYNGINSSTVSASTSSSHRWNFSKATERELDDAARLRKDINGPSSSRDGPPSSSSYRPTIGPTMGPTMPPQYGAVEALQNEREAERAAREDAKYARKGEYKKAAREAREEERDNRATGRDRLMEKRAEGNAVRKEYGQRRDDDAAPELDEDTLMGGGGSFAAMVAARDRAKANGRGRMQEERKAVMSDKMQAARAKEDETMAQFRALAAARFG